MRILNIIKYCFLAILFFTSCDKGDVYSPMTASVQWNSVMISCVDSSGTDLLSDENYVKKINIRGITSGRELPFKINKLENDGVERCYLSFKVDLPNTKEMKFSDTNNAVGISIVDLKINGLDVRLTCRFRYFCANKETIGENSIVIESIKYNNKEVTRTDHEMYSDFILHFVENNNIISLKD